MADELDVLADKLSIVRRRLPAIASRIDAVEQACRDLSVNVVPDEYVPIHRDFYSDQLLIDQDRIWMLDIDLVALGDPALDIGNFLGHVTELGLRAAGDADAGSMFEDALKERVLELYGSAFIDRAEVFRTLTLARHLWISTEKPDRVAFTEPLLELCESRLSSPSIHRPSGVVL
jgi:aminoglycoside phosphotransferase (APT) family kinase protein